MKRQAGGDVHNVVSGTVHGDVAQAGRDIHRSLDDPDAPAAVADCASRSLRSNTPRPPGEPPSTNSTSSSTSFARPNADKVEVKRRLTRFTDVIRGAGGLMASGASVAGAIDVIVRWLNV